MAGSGCGRVLNGPGKGFDGSGRATAVSLMGLVGRQEGLRWVGEGGGRVLDGLWRNAGWSRRGLDGYGRPAG